jgi:hypothetical protein
MTLEKYFKSGTRANPASPLGLALGREVAQSARRHLWRAFAKERGRHGPRDTRATLEADHILRHVQQGDGTCSQCPAYLIRKAVARA